MSIWKRLFGSKEEKQVVQDAQVRHVEEVPAVTETQAQGDFMSIISEAYAADRADPWRCIVNWDRCSICFNKLEQTADGHYWCNHCALSTNPELRASLVNRIQYPQMRESAVEKLWELSPQSAPEDTAVSYAIRCLRDESECRMYYRGSMSPLEALGTLRDARPDRRRDFDMWMMYAWCGSDNDLAELGYKLIDLFDKYGTFLGGAKTDAAAIGEQINDHGDISSMKTVWSAVGLIFGGPAARELEVAWGGVGAWQA